MPVVASVLLAYAAVAAGVVAGSRAVRRRRPMVSRATPVLWGAAVAAVAGAFALWPRSDGAALAGVSVGLTVTAMASVFVLLEPLVPRLVWLLAGLAPVLAALVMLT
jgi:hypothetical protein